MSKKRLVLCLKIIIVFCLFISCKKSENVENVKITSKNFSILVADDFERTNNLNELSEVQFQNKEKDLYFIILQEPKINFENAVKQNLHKSTPNLLGYFNVIKNHFQEITKDFKLSDFGKTKIDSCNAIVFSMSGIDPEDNKKIYYRYAIIEDEKNYYQIMSWTNLKNKLLLIGKVDQTINSFKRIEN